MGQDDSWVSTTLKTRFTQSQQDPLEHFVVRLRQLRAKQLCQLLADPTTVTLEIFNREVWPLGSMMVNGRTIGVLMNIELGINAAQLPEFMTALEQGKVEIHGNAIWGSGSRIYGSQLKESDEEKVHSIRQALVILNDTTLSPLVKAQRIDELPGFGSNSSTGLVMVFHPTEFAIYNEPSQNAMHKLGFSFENLEEFQEKTRALKEQLGAIDFFELDWFLYLVYKGRIQIDRPNRQVWWVNQGTTFAIEKAGGYLWAPKHGKNNVVFQHWSDMTKIQPGDVVLHYANGALRAVSSVQESAKDQPRPSELSAETWESEGYLVRTEYYLLEPPIPLQNLPREWRIETTGPFTRDGGVKQGYLFPLTNEFADKFQDRFGAVLPVFFQPMIEQKQTWLFQANPKIYNLSAQLKEVTVGSMDDWLVTSYRNEMDPGDRVLLWESGPQGGLLAIGELTGEPFQRKPSSWRPGNHEELEWAVPFQYTQILSEAIPRAAFLQDSVLKNMHHIRFAQGSNFKVTEEEWGALQKLIDLQSEPKATLLTIEFAEINQRILEQGLNFSYEVVANYLLALQTKRFVILTGISGTGKTQLAMAVARCFDRSSLKMVSHENMVPPKRNEENVLPSYSRLVAVRPDWRDIRGLLGYYNPLLEQYSVTPILHLLMCAQEEFEAAYREGRDATPFFIILDEMNLARVEHYFSDFLSSIESGEQLNLQEHQSTGMDENGGTMIVPAQLKIYNNVFFTGTVNIDETTYMFSPKVLDRAFTLELNEVNLASFGQHEPEREGDITPLYLQNFPGRLNYDHKPNTTDWERFGQLLNGELRDVVVQLNELLSDARQNFGYRVASEIARFVILVSEQTEGTATALWTALDLAILQKVLPKFNGTQQELEEVLSSVFVFSIAGKRVNEAERKRFNPEAWHTESGHLIIKRPIYGEPSSQPRLPRTATKLWTMWNRLRKQGFTSYIS
jgi:hypothetical protein